MDPLLARVLDEAEARQLPALIAEWSAADDERRWIARALRIDLALLTERPELVIPAVHRRCALLGSREEEAFFDRQLAPPLAPTLRERVATWIAAWAPGRRWLAAAWPPAVPLDGGVLEEYRTGVDGELRFSSDGDVLGVVGTQGAVAWERSTGRRLDGPIDALAAKLDQRVFQPRGWRITSNDFEGVITLELAAEDRRVEVPQGDYEVTTGLRELSDELAIVQCSYADGGDTHYFIDLVRGRILGQSSGYCWGGALSPDGARMYLAYDQRVRVFEGERELGEWASPNAGALVIGPGGAVATRSGPVIRVWDPAAAITSGLTRRIPAAPSRTAWAPDGRRALSQSRLVDGRTGDVLTELPLNNPSGWLEGGPPPDCQVLCTGVLAESTPIALKVWDTHQGRQIVQDDTRGAYVRDAVAFDPRGRFYAWYRERHGRLEVTRLVEGTPVFARPVRLARAAPRDTVLAFSRDGELLWWRAEDGTRWAISLATLQPGRLGADDPDPAPWRAETVATPDGLLELGDLALPVEESELVASPDGTRFLAAGSFVLVRDGA